MKRQWPGLMLVLLALMMTGCHWHDSQIASCDDKIPLMQDFEQQPVFAPLQYHNRINYIAQNQNGYDLWADAKFEYRSGLEFKFIPIKQTTIGNEFCFNDVSMLLATPLSVSQKNMLSALISKISKRMAFNPDILQKKILKMVADKESYQKIAATNHLILKGGMLHHPFRGDFFVVEMELQ